MRRSEACDADPGGRYNPAMPNPPVTPLLSKAQPTPNTRPHPDAVLCERCGEEMFRMHAVWRCPKCRYKTDCCGW
jgi:hypothetical protein